MGYAEPHARECARVAMARVTMAARHCARVGQSVFFRARKVAMPVWRVKWPLTVRRLKKEHLLLERGSVVP